MANHHSKRTSHSYYVCMIDYGNGPKRPMGLEAIVNPEHTRRDIVQMLKTGEAKHVAFIHHVDGLFIEDVTDEIFDQAETELRAEAQFTPIDRLTGQDAIDWQNDRRRALRMAE